MLKTRSLNHICKKIVNYNLETLERGSIDQKIHFDVFRSSIKRALKCRKPKMSIFNSDNFRIIDYTPQNPFKTYITVLIVFDSLCIYSHSI